MVQYGKLKCIIKLITINLDSDKLMDCQINKGTFGDIINFQINQNQSIVLKNLKVKISNLDAVKNLKMKISNSDEVNTALKEIFFSKVMSAL